MFAITFTLSCSSGDDNNNNGGDPNNGGGVPFNENSQVYNEDGTKYTGNGIIEIVTGTCSYGNEPPVICPNDGLVVGNITNGIVNFSIPTEVPKEYLRDIDGFFDRKEGGSSYKCTDYTEGVEIFGNLLIMREMFVLTNSNREIIGDLGIDSWTAQSIERMTYIYLSKAGKFTCSLSVEEDGLIFKETININATEGWNKLYARYYMKGNPVTLEISTSNILKNEVKWIMHE
jgi:hypothetical protein